MTLGPEVELRDERSSLRPQSQRVQTQGSIGSVGLSLELCESETEEFHSFLAEKEHVIHPIIVIIIVMINTYVYYRPGTALITVLVYLLI